MKQLSGPYNAFEQYYPLEDAIELYNEIWYESSSSDEWKRAVYWKAGWSHCLTFRLISQHHIRKFRVNLKCGKSDEVYKSSSSSFPPHRNSCCSSNRNQKRKTTSSKQTDRQRQTDRQKLSTYGRKVRKHENAGIWIILQSTGEAQKQTIFFDNFISILLASRALAPSGTFK